MTLAHTSYTTISALCSVQYNTYYCFMLWVNTRQNRCKNPTNWLFVLY